MFPLCALTLAIADISQSQAARPTFTETFDIEEALCEGLEVNGVTYSFTFAGAPSDNCTAGMNGPTTANIEPPCMQYGAGGVLHLTFVVPSTVFGFGVA